MDKEKIRMEMLSHCDVIRIKEGVKYAVMADNLYIQNPPRFFNEEDAIAQKIPYKKETDEECLWFTYPE